MGVYAEVAAGGETPSAMRYCDSLGLVRASRLVNLIHI
jgi:hypothetical protein